MVCFVFISATMLSCYRLNPHFSLSAKQGDSIMFQQRTTASDPESDNDSDVPDEIKGDYIDEITGQSISMHASTSVAGARFVCSESTTTGGLVSI